MVLRRPRLIAALAAACLLLGGVGVAAYLTVMRPAGDVSNPGVAFEDETPTPAPKKAKGKKDRFVWPIYGFTKDHRRDFQPGKPLRGPWRMIWRHRAPALLEFPPVMSGDTLYQLADNGRIAAIAKRTGRTRWKRRIGHLAASSPAVAGGIVYATVLETARGSGKGRIVALRARDGKRLWTRRLPSRSESSPLVDGGRVYFGSENGTVFALRARSGRPVWTYRAPGAVKASPTLARGLLYFGDYGGNVQAVRAATGRRVWSNDEARSLLRGGRFYATAAVAFGRVYVGATDGRMYSFSARDGDLAWAHQTGNYVYSSAAIRNVDGLGPTVYFGSYDGIFYALDARSGKVRWRHRSGGKISGSPTIVADTIYYANLGRSLTFALGLRTGRVVGRWFQGGYDPVTSDGRYLFLTGRRTLTAIVPQKVARREGIESLMRKGGAKKRQDNAKRRSAKERRTAKKRRAARKRRGDDAPRSAKERRATKKQRAERRRAAKKRRAARKRRREQRERSR